MKHARVVAGIALGLVALALASFYTIKVPAPAPATPKSAPQPFAAAVPAYVGVSACTGCHAAEVGAWQGSHHDLAMQHASAQSVLGNFDNARYEYDGVTTTFTKRDGQFFIHTDGVDGKLTDYPVRYTFGVSPLQQYLVELAGGRLQAVGIAWDSRSKEQGGQRWFHLYPNEKVDHKDELHWTKRAQNWNYMCAECHSTNVKKNYDLASDSFDTKWSELNVACEACHGPASQHVAWANKTPGAEHDEQKGLVFRLGDRRGASWVLSPNVNTAVRSSPRQTSTEMDTCARCHSRRSMLSEDYRHGKSILDTHLPALLTQPSYHPDGQIKEEDFEYGSFLQSKMFHQGVTCSDCHEPHSLKLRAPGNQTCLQCHKAEAYDNEKHHFHAPQGKGAVCTACHMPTTNFMVIHARHDHSIRIPRPDLSLKLATPNACNNCHADKSAGWAAGHMQKWYGKEWSNRWHFGETLFAAQQGQAQAGQELIAAALAPQVPDIARAAASALLPNYLDPTVAVVLPRLLSDKSPLVRRAALEVVDAVPPQERLRVAANLLSDPLRAVRIEAARVLSVVPRNLLTPSQGQALDKGLREYVEVALASAEHPQSHVNLGLLYLGLGQIDQAERAYLQAIKLDAAYAVAYVNLADLYRQQQMDAKAEVTLLQARAKVGENAAVEHALGLHYVRSKQMSQALSALAEAARLEPSNARYGYVYAVALDGSGASVQALKTLQGVHQLHPNDRDVLLALVGFSKTQGDVKAAGSYARKLLALDARYGSVEKIIEEASAR